jgi:hypothetical protein
MKVKNRHFYWMGAFLIIVLIWQFGIVSGGRKFRELDSKIVRKEKALEEMRGLQDEYLRVKKTVEEMRKSLDGRREDYTPLSFLEKLSQQLGVGYELTYREPRELSGEKMYMESSVGVEFKGISMGELTTYLYRVEDSSELLRVRNLHVSPRKDGLLRVSFEVSTLIPACES